MKGLPVNIYRDNSGDCTLGGVSSKTANMDRFILVDEKVGGPFNVEENEVYLIIVRRNLFGRVYMHLEPRINDKDLKPKGTVGSMMGGNFAYTSDSRFREVSDYPLPIHDRFESQELYEILSR